MRFPFKYHYHVWLAVSFVNLKFLIFTTLFDRRFLGERCLFQKCFQDGKGNLNTSAFTILFKQSNIIFVSFCTLQSIEQIIAHLFLTSTQASRETKFKSIRHLTLNSTTISITITSFKFIFKMGSLSTILDNKLSPK